MTSGFQLPEGQLWRQNPKPIRNPNVTPMCPNDLTAHARRECVSMHANIRKHLSKASQRVAGATPHLHPIRTVRIIKFKGSPRTDLHVHPRPIRATTRVLQPGVARKHACRKQGVSAQVYTKGARKLRTKGCPRISRLGTSDYIRQTAVPSAGLGQHTPNCCTSPLPTLGRPSQQDRQTQVMAWTGRVTDTHPMPDIHARTCSQTSARTRMHMHS